MKYYSINTLAVFNNVKHVFTATQHKYNFIGSAGDLDIGEYVKLYLDVELISDDTLNSKIIDSSFSSIGSVALIASVEYFCSIIKGITLAEALSKSSSDNFRELQIVEGSDHSLNFIFQAFYDIIQSISHYNK